MYTPHGAIADGPTLVARGSSQSGQGGVGSYGTYAPAGVHPYANWSVIAILLIAAVGLYALEKGGLRFVFTATKR